MSFTRALSAAFFASAFAAGHAQASAQQRFENLDRLDSLVATTIGATIGEPGGAVAPIDRRLKLAPCPELPEVSGPMFGAAIVRCDKLGWRLRVPLAIVAQPRAAAAAPAAKAEVVVRKGDPVELIAGGASFTLSRTMIADEDGAFGQIIRVRENAKAAPVKAQVVETGIVRVPGFMDF